MSLTDIKPGWYVLTKVDVPNPHADRRCARNFTAAAVFPAGVYRVEQHDREVVGVEYTVFEITRWDGNDYGREIVNPKLGGNHERHAYARAAALWAHLQPHTPTAQQIAVEALGSGVGAAARVLDKLLTLRIITTDDVRGAAVAVECDWERELS